jgi:hypothetical protein
VWNLNTASGFPPDLKRMRFRVIVLHYSLFGWPQHHYLRRAFREYLASSDSSYKVAFFQDEFRYCPQRFAFLNQYDVDCVYTLVEPAYFKDTYRKFTRVRKLVNCIPGYVSEDLIAVAGRWTKPDRDRRIDIGYRARPLDYYMGKGAQEKAGIAIEFVRRAASLNLRLDIAWDERSRLYGSNWYKFMRDCRAVLGVEAGVSIFDTDGTIRQQVEGLLAANAGISFQEVHDTLLYQWEDRIPYRTISPRHFEAAAFRVCQILFEGEYSGILQPMVHYIPLRKDFANFDEVIRLFADADVRHGLTENAYRDLIASGRYSYERFLASFDAELRDAGIAPGLPDDGGSIRTLLERGTGRRTVRAVISELRVHSDFLPAPIKKALRPIVRACLDSGENS